MSTPKNARIVRSFLRIEFVGAEIILFKDRFVDIVLRLYRQLLVESVLILHLQTINVLTA